VTAPPVKRYIDALHMAAEEVVGRSVAQALEGFVSMLVPGLPDEPAWPTLRAHLLLLAMGGADPHERLRAACDAREISSADDRAAALDSRASRIDRGRECYERIFIAVMATWLLRFQAISAVTFPPPWATPESLEWSPRLI
jgi:hypothetical protein